MTEPAPMKEIHVIQEKIHDEERDLSLKERLKALHKEAEEAVGKFNLKLADRSVSLKKAA